MRTTIRPALVMLCAVLASCEHGQVDLSNYGGGVFTGNVNAAPPSVKLNAPATPAAEGSTITASVVLSSSFSQDIAVPFTVTLVSAGVNDIIQLTASPVVIASGQTTATIKFQVVDDPFQEEPPVETFTLTLGAPSQGVLGSPASATLSITDADDDGLGSSISGRVTSAATGSGLAGVAVSSLTAGGGAVAAVTDAQGFYTLTAPTPGASIQVTYTLAGYVPQSRTTEAMTTAQSAVVINVPMVPVATLDTFDPATAHVTTSGAVAQVSFAANSLETTSGAAPTGNVTAAVTPIGPSADLNAMPGMYRAGDGVAASVPVESFGGLAVSLVDSASNTLRLVSGQSATVRIPASTRGTTLPASLALYYYDPALGLWRQEGTATLGGIAPDQYYEGAITRFATWGANVPYTTATATGCVVDSTGSPVPEATVVAEGTTYSGNATAVTNAQGAFTVPVRSGSTGFAQATFRTGISNALDVPPLSLGTCLTVFAGAASIKLTWGEFPTDLDSHTLGPNQDSHARWDDKGSLVALPFVALDVDDVTGFGPEVTTIAKAARNRTYRFIVQNYSHTFAPGQTGSPARVELFIKGRQTVFTPPAGETGGTPTWHVFDLVTDANCDITTVTPSAAPWLALDEFTLDEPSTNPNTDNAATFCN